MAITDNINKVFGVETEKQISTTTKSIKTDLKANQKEEDIDLARSILVDLLTKSNDLLDESIVLAKESQSPRAFEVSGTLIKTIAEVAQDLISIHEDKNKSGKKSVTVAPEAITNTQNNIYIGSTADLTKMLKDAQATVDAIDGEVI